MPAKVKYVRIELVEPHEETTGPRVVTFAIPLADYDALHDIAENQGITINDLLLSAVDYLNTRLQNNSFTQDELVSMKNRGAKAEANGFAYITE